MRSNGRFAHFSYKMQCANRPFWPLVSKYTNFRTLLYIFKLFIYLYMNLEN